MLPSTLGNAGPQFRLAMTLPPGPRRLVDDGELARFYIPPLGKPPKRPATSRLPRLGDCRDILVVKLDFIGDWVLATPFLESLRRSAPGARITVAVLERVFALASTCRFVDRTIAICRAEGRRIVLGAASPAELGSFRADFEGGAFDLALVPRFDADFNGALQFAHASRAAAIVGFSEVSTARKRSLNRGDDRYYTHAFVDPRPFAHEAERDLALVAALGASIGPRRPVLDVLPSDFEAALSFLAKSFDGASDRVLAVAPFGSEPKKTLPADILAPVVRRLAERFGCRVAVLASPGETARAEAFARSIGGSARSAAGRLGMREIAALLHRAVALIGMDSGPAHIAAAVGTPVAVLACHAADGRAEHTSAPERFGPLGPEGGVLILRPDRLTPPCIDGCEAAQAHCILGLTEDRLVPALSGFLRSVPAVRPPASRTRSSSALSRDRG